MNLILFTADDRLDQDHIEFRDSRHKQILKVHRAKIGDSVRVGEVNGLMGRGIIKSLDPDRVQLTIELIQSPPPKLPLTILLALPRPKMIRRIMRTVAELGVEQLIVINSYKVEKSFWQSPALKDENIRQYLLAGLQQSKDTVLPKVSFNKRFKPFVEDELPTLISDRRALLAHPGATSPCPRGPFEATTLAIGPEGGFTPYEVDKLMAMGFAGINLGPRILRVENALAALVAKLF